MWKGSELIRSLAIDFTGKCNLNCSYCYLYSKQEADKKEISVDELITTVKKAIKWFPNIELIELWGGEATYDPQRLHVFCQAMYDIGATTWIPSTNGTLLHKPEYYNAWRFCNQYRASQFSFDGNPKYHNKQRSNSFDIVLENLGLVLRQRVPVSLRTTYSFEDYIDSINENLIWYPKIYKSFSEDTNLDQTVVDKTFCIYPYKNKKLMMIYQEIDTIFQVKHAAVKSNIYRNYYHKIKNMVLDQLDNDVIFLPPYINDTVMALLQSEPSRTKNCALLSNQVYLHAPTGDIYPCLSQDVDSYQSIAKLGNVHTMEINWPIVNTVRSFIVTRNNTCQDCSIRSACFGACYHTLPAETDTFNSYWNTNNIIKCKFAHSIFDVVLDTSQAIIDYIDKNNK